MSRPTTATGKGDPARIGVIGAGAWGTALAATEARAGHRVTLWAREPEVAGAIVTRHENPLYLPGITLPETIEATTDPAALAASDAVLLVTPAQAVREVMAAFAAHLAPATPLVICAKGIERASGRFLDEVVREVAPRLVPFVLSGPSFARDVARGLPAAVTLAGDDIADARRLARMLSHRVFRLYSSDDVRGVQIGGALKNVLAIACGIVDGLGLGDSARAALLTRAFAELARFGRALGARVETLHGLSGLGDLALTATSGQSRNYSLGRALGEGRALDDILGERRAVTEGVFTASIAVRLAREHAIDMPICESVHAVVSGASTPRAEVERLLARPLRDEAG
ncbi:MAG TPA: NAD(P)-dependent glycerol-3-phosphate dehydrogenase [Thermopetrobacter sp.]|nr:NAD(P)-dependent glycerol-3-phosphate dehydrogenase [Thermopetrobacter sp.]